jgi:hypothetical protein
MTSRRRDELGRLAGFCMARPWVEPRGAVPTARMSGRQLVLASREIVGGAG